MAEHDEYTTDFSSLTQNEMSQVYSKLSVSANFDNCDDNAICNKMLDTIESLFDKDFLQINTEELQKNGVLLNVNLAKLINEIRNKQKIQDIGLIFISFCDYFALDYSLTFNELHPKIQNAIKFYCKKIVGATTYSKMENNKNNGLVVNSLFDLL